MAWFNSLLSSCLNKLFLILGEMHTKCTFLSATPFPAFSEMILLPLNATEVNQIKLKV